MIIDRDAVIEKLTEVITEFGLDHRAPKIRVRNTYPEDSTVCRYVVDDQPSCVVGQVMHRFGVPIDVLLDWDVPGNSIDNIIDGPGLPDGMTLTAGALEVLVRAQSIQDGMGLNEKAGEPWGRIAEELGLSI